ncbi:hypothetical protein [Desertimonas flava]|jgi:hypothetical protein|nr:hypothetical protein [Desertimonas flava]
MEDAGFIITAYVAVAVSTIAYAWNVIRRGRRAAAQLADDDKPWM